MHTRSTHMHTHSAHTVHTHTHTHTQPHTHKLHTPRHPLCCSWAAPTNRHRWWSQFCRRLERRETPCDTLITPFEKKTLRSEVTHARHPLRLFFFWSNSYNRLFHKLLQASVRECHLQKKNTYTHRNFFSNSHHADMSSITRLYIHQYFVLDFTKSEIVISSTSS